MKNLHQNTISNQKKQQNMPSLQAKKRVSFEFKQIGCFITSSSKNISNANRICKKINKEIADKPKISHQKEVFKMKQQKKLSFSQIKVPRKNKGIVPSNNNRAFNNSLLLLQYEYSDQNKADPCLDNQKEDSPKNENANVNDIVNSCAKVITQQTQNSSNPVTARFQQASSPFDYSYQQMPNAQMFMPFLQQQEYPMMKVQVRKRYQVDLEQSKAFIIDLKMLEADGRTSIMIRNIPNKYTQEDLLELFEKNHKKKFDFFYLPIDLRQNNCNVGYAFINFIHTKFIPDFYLEFNLKKWKKFYSSKVCNVCYARIQGTTQLEKHFLNSKVIQQNDRRLRPLIGLKSLTENIQNLVQMQKNKEQDQERQYF